MPATAKPIQTVEQYIASFPNDIQRLLRGIRQTIRKAAPHATWAIKYRIPTLIFNGMNLVHFAAFKHHIGFYPTPSAIKAFKSELSPYKGAKGSVQFPLTQPMPLQLIRKIVLFRIGEMEHQSRRRRT